MGKMEELGWIWNPKTNAYDKIVRQDGKLFFIEAALPKEASILLDEDPV